MLPSKAVSAMHDSAHSRSFRAMNDYGIYPCDIAINTVLDSIQLDTDTADTYEYATCTFYRLFNDEYLDSSQVFYRCRGVHNTARIGN